jgi:meromycolic acid enoyl-[acyl-carrier-protein] reductase
MADLEWGTDMGILQGKRILVTGVVTDKSIAYEVARLAQEQGATVVLTSFGRAFSITKRVASKLPVPAEVIELDVTDQEHLDRLPALVGEHVDGLDGVVHSIAFAPQSALGGNFLNTPWEDVSVALQISAFSLKALAVACKPMMTPGSSIVGFDFDASVAWPIYDWMGVSKAALEATARYLARDLGPAGIRVNLVAAGPIATMAAKSIPDFHRIEALWNERSPLVWDPSDAEPTARTCIGLLSDWFPSTTGEIVHCDGGVHAVGG